MNDWYYAIGQQQQGPVSREILLQLIRAGQVRPQDLVWNSLLANWLPAADVEGLLAEAGQAPATIAVGERAPTWPAPASPGSDNPYASPAQPAGAVPAPPMLGSQWGGHVKAVAIILIVYGGLSSVGSLICGGMYGAIAVGAFPPNRQATAEDRMFGSIFAAIMAVYLVMSIITIVAGLQCLKLRARGLAIAASIMCILTCNFLGIAAGIYGLVILLNSDAARLFRRDGTA